MKKIGFTLLLIILAGLSCDKDDISPEDATKIKLGEYTNMLIQRFDTLIIGGYNEMESFDLDLDADGSYDYRFTAEVFGSPAMGQHPQIRLLSLNSNCLLNGYLLNDTTFYRFQTDTSYGENWTPVMISNTTTYSCERSETSDSIISFKPDIFNINYFNSGEYIFRSDLYWADTIKLSDELYGDFSFPINKPDTTIYNYIYYYNTCNSIPNDDILYLGIKLKSENDEKIGWIKLVVISNYRILILETAIQK